MRGGERTTVRTFLARWKRLGNNGGTCRGCITGRMSLKRFCRGNKNTLLAMATEGLTFKNTGDFCRWINDTAPRNFAIPACNSGMAIRQGEGEGWGGGRTLTLSSRCIFHRINTTHLLKTSKMNKSCTTERYTAQNGTNCVACVFETVKIWRQTSIRRN